MSDRVPQERPSKRQRRQQQENDGVPLIELCIKGQWDAVRLRLQSHPFEVTKTDDVMSTKRDNRSISSTPLAWACRLGAPHDVIKAILEASPMELRRWIPSYGTPLHEAIVCEKIDSNIIEMLLKVDEELESRHENLIRAALRQDVDGHTPLHLLIKRRFQSFPPHPTTYQDDWMNMLRALVKSCPEAVEITDCGEYEEPPLVMALKASLYAHFSVSTTTVATRTTATEPHHQVTLAFPPNNHHEGDLSFQMMEQRIHTMVAIMLSHSPRAASKVLRGARGQYTALHSAVFHGRCSKTIELLLQAEQQQQQEQSTANNNNNSNNAASLLANTQGELPLHFCAMRGEPPKTMALLSEAAPQALWKRDSSGCTPMHWLWVRFISTILSLDENNNNNDNALDSNNTNAETTTDNEEHDEPIVATTTVQADENDTNDRYKRYTSWSELEGGEDYYADMRLVRRLDPPVDFLHMRHIPPQLLGEQESSQDFVQQTHELLQHIYTRYQQFLQEQTRRQEQESWSISTNNNNLNVEGQDDDETNDAQQDEPQEERNVISWTRREAVTALFWTKVVSVLQAASKITNRQGPFLLAHTAMATVACPPPIVRVVMALYPNEWLVVDHKGRLPLHYAATRLGFVTVDDIDRDNTGPMRGRMEAPRESLTLLQDAMTASPAVAARVADQNGRIVLHHAIDTFVKAACGKCGDDTSGRHFCYCCTIKTPTSGPAIAGSSAYSCAGHNVLKVLHDLVKLYPDSLERKDGPTKLYPFLQATAAASEYQHENKSDDAMTLSITYLLLRENPSLLKNF